MNKDNNTSETGEYVFDDDVYLAQLLAQLAARKKRSDTCTAPNPADSPHGPGPDRLF